MVVYDVFLSLFCIFNYYWLLDVLELFSTLVDYSSVGSCCWLRDACLFAQTWNELLSLIQGLHVRGQGGWQLRLSCWQTSSLKRLSTLVKGSSHSCEILLLHWCLCPKLIVLKILHLSRWPLRCSPLAKPKLLMIDTRCRWYLPLSDKDSSRLTLLRELIEVSGSGMAWGLGTPSHDSPLLRRLFICRRSLLLLLLLRWDMLFFLFLLYLELDLGLYLFCCCLNGWYFCQLIVVVVAVPKLFLPGVIVDWLLFQSVIFLLITHFFIDFLGHHIIISWTLLLRFIVFIMPLFIIISRSFFIDF